MSAVLLTGAGSISATMFFTNPIMAVLVFTFKYRKSREVEDEDFSWLVKLADVKLKKKKLKLIEGLDNAFANRNSGTISYGDTLYNRQERSDRQFVIAHELGHQKGWGISINTWILLGLAIVIVWMVTTLTNSSAIIMVTAISLFSMVMVLVRWDGEFYADDFACHILGPRAAINALRRLGPSSRLSIVSDSHPSIARRIRRIEKKWGISASLS